jgi:hypothetical protein
MLECERDDLMLVMSWYEQPCGLYLCLLDFVWMPHRFLCVEFVSRITEIASRNSEKITLRVACVEIASSNEGFSHVVFILEDLEDPLINASIWIRWWLRAFIADLLGWMRGSQLADDSWAYFKNIFSISARFSRAGDETLKGQAVPSLTATCKGYLKAFEYQVPKSLFSRANQSRWISVSFGFLVD